MVDILSHGRRVAPDRAAPSPAAARDPDVAAHLGVALQAPRSVLTRLLAAAPHPPPDPAESARRPPRLPTRHVRRRQPTSRRGARRRATDALEAIWERLLA